MPQLDVTRRAKDADGKPLESRFAPWRRAGSRILSVGLVDDIRILAGRPGLRSIPRPATLGYVAAGGLGLTASGHLTNSELTKGTGNFITDIATLPARTVWGAFTAGPEIQELMVWLESNPDIDSRYPNLATSLKTELSTRIDALKTATETRDNLLEARKETEKELKDTRRSDTSTRTRLKDQLEEGKEKFEESKSKFKTAEEEYTTLVNKVADLKNKHESLVAHKEKKEGIGSPPPGGENPVVVTPPGGENPVVVAPPGGGVEPPPDEPPPGGETPVVVPPPVSGTGSQPASRPERQNEQEANEAAAWVSDVFNTTAQPIKDVWNTWENMKKRDPKNKNWYTGAEALALLLELFGSKTNYSHQAV